MIFFEPKRIYNGPFTGYYDKPVEPWKKHRDSIVPKGHYSRSHWARRAPYARAKQ